MSCRVKGEELRSFILITCIGSSSFSRIGTLVTSYLIFAEQVYTLCLSHDAYDNAKLQKI